MNGSRRHRRDEGGQILVLFALAIVAIVAVLGLVLDGGSAFAQRRDEQNASDLASLAGAMAYLSAPGDHAAKAAAADAAGFSVAAENGYVDGVDGVTIVVDVIGVGEYATIRVSVAKPHQNTFSSIVGMPTWDIGTTANTEVSSSPNGVNGAMPLLFNADAFPGALCDESSEVCVPEVYQQPGTGNEDVPQDATQFNWTIFCTANGNPCNANSNGVRELIDGGGTATTIYVDDMIGPLNAGAHTTLFGALGEHTGETFPVPIVCTVNNDPTCPGDGAMVGYAYFKLLSVEGASDKVIRGYFVSPIRDSELAYDPTRGDATLLTGAYLFKLID